MRARSGTTAASVVSSGLPRQCQQLPAKGATETHAAAKRRGLIACRRGATPGRPTVLSCQPHSSIRD